MRLGRSVFWNFSAFLWFTLLILLVTPYMVSKMGLEAFGLWAVISASNGYLCAMDFGLGNALIRFLAAENERGDRQALQGYLRSGVSLGLGGGLLIALALLLASDSLARDWIRVPRELEEEATAAFRISALAVLLTFVSAVYAAVPAALHRFDLLAARTFLLLTLQYVLVVLVLAGGGGLTDVVWVYTLGAGCVVVYLGLISRRLLAGMNLLPGWDRGAVRELLRFGRGKFPAQISNTLLQQFDRVALGALLPVGMVSFYAVPLRISQRIGQVAENVASPFYPAVASHLVADRIDSLREQYCLGARAVAILSGGALAILGGFASPILSVWMGREFADQGTWPFRLLLLAYTAGSFFTFPSVAADAAARPGIPAVFLCLGSLVHGVFIWLAVPRWGLVGAATGVLIGFLIPLVLGVPTLHGRVPALPPLRSLLRDLRGILLSSFLTLTAAVMIARFPYPWEGIAQLALSLIGCGSLYLGLLLLFRGLRPGDFNTLLRAFRRDGWEVSS